MKNLLKFKRWEAGIKQYELANLLGCSASYLSMVENGRMEPTKDFKEKTALLLNLSIQEIFPEKKMTREALRATYPVSQ